MWGAGQMDSSTSRIVDAIATGAIEDLRRLLEEGADPNQEVCTKITHRRSMSLISFAAWKAPDPCILRALVEAGAVADDSIHWHAAVNPSTDVFDAVFEMWGDPPSLDEEGNNLLFLNLPKERVQKLVERGLDLNHVNAEGRTPLTENASDDCIELVFELLSNGADPDKPGLGLTPLMHASMNKAGGVFMALIEAGADPKGAVDGVSLVDILGEIEWFGGEDSMFSLMLAMQHIEPCDLPVLVHYVMASGAMWSTDPPMLHAAVHAQDPLIIAALVNGEASVDVLEYPTGWSPLMKSSALNPNPEITVALIAAGDDVNECTEDGVTPLRAAAAHSKSPGILEILLDSGADPLCGTFPRSLFDSSFVQVDLLAERNPYIPDEHPVLDRLTFLIEDGMDGTE